MQADKRVTLNKIKIPIFELTSFKTTPPQCADLGMAYSLIKPIT